MHRKGFAEYGCPSSQKIRKNQLEQIQTTLLRQAPRDISEYLSPMGGFALYHHISFKAIDKDPSTIAAQLDRWLQDHNFTVMGKAVRATVETHPRRRRAYAQWYTLHRELEMLRPRGGWEACRCGRAFYDKWVVFLRAKEGGPRVTADEIALAKMGLWLDEDNSLQERTKEGDVGADYKDGEKSEKENVGDVTQNMEKENTGKINGKGNKKARGGECSGRRGIGEEARQRRPRRRRCSRRRGQGAMMVTTTASTNPPRRIDLERGGRGLGKQRRGHRRNAGPDQEQRWQDPHLAGSRNGHVDGESRPGSHIPKHRGYRWWVKTTRERVGRGDGDPHETSWRATLQRDGERGACWPGITRTSGSTRTAGAETCRTSGATRERLGGGGGHLGAESVAAHTPHTLIAGEVEQRHIGKSNRARGVAERWEGEGRVVGALGTQSGHPRTADRNAWPEILGAWAAEK